MVPQMFWHIHNPLGNHQAQFPGYCGGHKNVLWRAYALHGPFLTGTLHTVTPIWRIRDSKIVASYSNNPPPPPRRFNLLIWMSLMLPLSYREDLTKGCAYLFLDNIKKYALVADVL